MTKDRPSTAAERPRWPNTRHVLTLAACVLLLVAACGSRDVPSPRSLNASRAKYQLLMIAYAAEAGPAIDPMTFTPAPTSEAGVGPLSIRHVAGIAPVKGTKSPNTRLLGADGKALGTTLGRWDRARGKVAFTCVGSKRRATSTLTGLLPGATYSAFVVHTAFDGPRRFSPWGDPAGTTNNFKASASGTASPINDLDGCSSNADDIIIIWHSDGITHGKSPGAIGVNWHTSLIARVP